MDQSSQKRSDLMRTALAQGYLSTPGGFRKPSFVHIVRPNQSVVKRGGVSHLMDMVTSALVEPPATEIAQLNPANQSGGWVTWASWNNGTATSISSFSTSWRVPPLPATQSGQLVYLFNGLQNPAGKEILQPVLQWGSSGAGGGNFWSIASWHADSNGQAFCTPSVPVNPGDLLTGIMTEVAVFNDGTRNYKCEFAKMAGTSLMALGMPELTAAEQTLEAYGITGQGDYPAAPSTAMTQIDLQVGGNPAPLASTASSMQNPQYGERTNIASDATPGGEVDLYY